MLEKKEKYLKIKSITIRWIINNLLLIVLILVLLVVILSAYMKNYYYSSVKNTMRASSNTISILIRNYNEDEKNINTEIRSIVENYSLKDKIELMAIDYNSKVAITSSWFDLGGMDMPDYQEAVSSQDGMGFYEGTLLDEKIMALSVVIPVESSEFAAMRYIVSLSEIDKTIFASTLIFIAAVTVIFIFTLLSGVYFIKSIVIPVRRIGTAARKIAAGDLATRLDTTAKDELGELCKTINYMADELDESERIKNEFISSVSHELRTPLTAIKGWGETILSSGARDTSTLNKGMGVIISETERLSQMVEELLDFSRMQGGKFTIIKTKLDILAELGEAVLIFGERAKRDGKMISYEEPEFLPYIFGDKNRLKQVFVNIIDNALKYSDDGDTVTITAIEEDDFIVVTIADTGCGISKEDLPHITKKFYKSTVTSRYGSGIGLAVVNEIINMHDGILNIESELDIGTLVTIKLPIDTKNNETSDPQISTTEIITEIHDDVFDTKELP